MERPKGEKGTGRKLNEVNSIGYNDIKDGRRERRESSGSKARETVVTH